MTEPMTEPILRHICEVCGDEKHLTPQQAFRDGWDYPPRMGTYGVVSPRTCPNCPIDKTVWWAIAIAQRNISDTTDPNYDPQQMTTLLRIIGEPETILIENTPEKSDT